MGKHQNNHGCVENELSFGGNSNQAPRNPFQIYGAGIMPTNYTERVPKQTSGNKKKTIKKQKHKEENKWTNKQMCDQLWCDKCVDRAHPEPR